MRNKILTLNNCPVRIIAHGRLSGWADSQQIPVGDVWHLINWFIWIDEKTSYCLAVYIVLHIIFNDHYHYFNQQQLVLPFVLFKFDKLSQRYGFVQLYSEYMIALAIFLSYSWLIFCANTISNSISYEEIYTPNLFWLKIMFYLYSFDYRTRPCKRPLLGNRPPLNMSNFC
jgi:hypothetical protein